MNLPMKLVSLRKQKGLTQLDLAEKLNVSRQAISRWEVGSAVPGTDNLKVLGELYGVSVDYLLRDDAEDSSKTAERQIQTLKEQGWIVMSKKCVGIFTCALLIVVAIVITICVTAFPKQEQEEIIPIEDLSVCTEDIYPVEIFQLTPMD